MSPPPEFRRTVTDMGVLHLVKLYGELDFESQTGLADWLSGISGSAVVIDLSGLTFIDACGIGAFIVARNRIMDTGNELILTRLLPNVQRVFEIAGLGGLVSEWSTSGDSVLTHSGSPVSPL